MARKYLIETFGCQMNVHDSERMAGLLEQAGYEATDDAADADVVVINTCSVRERAEEKLYTRLGELRELARRARARSDRRRRRLRGAAGRRGDPQARRPAWPTSSSARRRSAGCRCSSTQAATQRAPAARRSRSRTTTSRFRSASTRRTDPVKAYVTIIEGCNEFCSFCVVPYTRGHERMRPVADILAEVREAAGDRAPRGPAARPDRQSLPGAGRSRRATSRLLEAIHDVAGHRAHPLREPASAARHAAIPRRDARPAEGLQAPAPAGAVRLDARPRGDAPPLHARELSRAGRRASATRCRTSRSRPT